ncbi:EAL domain-containing protein [Enterococcus hailinensis]|uniref:EAL domain-containing protein n=1 Tax=Enterococcus hailinensis TaxID=3238988 RepID=UPI0038B24DCE
MDGRYLKDCLSDFYLSLQPIVSFCKEVEKIEMYEVLLRSTSTNEFPKSDFLRLVYDEQANRLFLSWYKEKLTYFLSENPKIHVTLNLHPIQLSYAGTWTFLSTMKIFNQKLLIEITEHNTSVADSKVYREDILPGSLKRIQQLGFFVAFDDVGTGLNTLESVDLNIHQIEILKFSLLPFEKAEEEDKIEKAKKWASVARNKNKRFVVEGVESRNMSNQLVEANIFLQQGYLWSSKEMKIE